MIAILPPEVAEGLRPDDPDSPRRDAASLSETLDGTLVKDLVTDLVTALVTALEQRGVAAYVVDSPGLAGTSMTQGLLPEGLPAESVLTLGSRLEAAPPAAPSRGRSLVWTIHLPASDGSDGPEALRQPLSLPEGPGQEEATRAAADRAADSAATKLLAALGLEREALQPDSIAVIAVDGAPGDGDTALRRLMVHDLRGAGLVAEDTATPPPGAFSLLGEVIVAEPVEGWQQVRITWTVLAPDGTVSGRASQESRIPRGALDGAWGPTALAVVRAAVPAITQILDQARRP